MGEVAPDTAIADVLLTRVEVCTRLRIGLNTLARITAKGDLKSVRIGDRRLYRATDVDAFIDASTT